MRMPKTLSELSAAMHVGASVGRDLTDDEINQCAVLARRAIDAGYCSHVERMLATDRLSVHGFTMHRVSRRAVRIRQAMSAL